MSENRNRLHDGSYGMADDVRREMVTVTAKNIILMIGIAIGVIGTLTIETALLLIVWLMVREREDDDE